jgi:PRELI-like family
VQASWRKYPNPMNTAVIGTDVVERKVLDGVLHTHRLVSSKWYFPKWAQTVSEHTQVVALGNKAIIFKRAFAVLQIRDKKRSITIEPN